METTITGYIGIIWYILGASWSILRSAVCEVFFLKLNTSFGTTEVTLGSKNYWKL